MKTNHILLSAGILFCLAFFNTPEAVAQDCNAECWRNKASSGVKDLRGADFRNASLYDLNLTGVDFTNADLRGANLNGSDLSGADLTNAKLSGAYFRGATLSSTTNLTDATLSEVNFHMTKLEGVNFSKAGAMNKIAFQGSNLNKANLSGKDISGSILTDVTMYGADLTGVSFLSVNVLRGSKIDCATKGVGNDFYKGGGFIVEETPICWEFKARNGEKNLSNAKLKGLNFKDMNFSGVSLQRADLENADLKGANLQSAILSGANVTAADLTGADVRWANLSGTKFNSTTKGINVADWESRGAENTDKPKPVVQNESGKFDPRFPHGRDPRMLKEEKPAEPPYVEPAPASEDAKNEWLAKVNSGSKELSNAQLDRTDLSGKDLSSCYFNFANLSGANLKDANLSSSVLGGTHLVGADLSGADVRWANLNGAIVSRSKTKGIDFADWEKRGAKVID